MTNIGGASDIVIPAVCPCDDTALEPPEAWFRTYYPECDTVDISVNDYVSLYDDPFLTGYYAEAGYHWGVDEGRCVTVGPGGIENHHGLTVEEAHACAALIWAFAVYELGLDCYREFPDFEPTP
jgi:hypothetical protein